MEVLYVENVTYNPSTDQVSVPPSVPSTTTGTEDAKGKTMELAATICSIESEYIPMVAAERDPIKVWKMLADANKSKCTASVHTLQNRLLNLKMAQGMSIRQFVNEICTIERQLAFAGKNVDESDKKYALLNGLRNEFALKKTILQENYDTSFEKMVSSLELTEDEMTTKGIVNSNIGPSASSFYAGQESSYKKTCHICSKAGHMMRDCFYNPRSKKFKRNMKPSPSIVAKMKSRRLIMDNTVSNGTKHGSDEYELAFVASTGDIKDKWFLDSCCTRPITNRRKNLIDYRKMKNADSIDSASQGGSMSVVGVGSVSVKQVLNRKEKVMLLKDVGCIPTCRANLLSLTKAQRSAIENNFIGGGTKMIAKYKDEVLMIADNRTTNIAELIGMVPVSQGKPEVACFSPGSYDAMKLAYRRTCHTEISTL